VDSVFHLADIDLVQLALACAVAFVASVMSGIAGYGAGLVLPVFLAPLVGVTNVIPMMSMVLLMNNFSRVIAFYRHIEWSHARLMLILGVPGCLLGAYSYTLLSSRWVALLLGLFLLISVPLRRILHRTSFRISPSAQCVAGGLFGFISGGMAGTGVILISIMMSAGLQGMALIATDGVIGVTMAITKILLFGSMSRLTTELALVGLMVGLCTSPGAFIARRLLTLIPMKIHVWVMEAVVVIGAVSLLWQGLR
jgi:uncharacterized membrane protein YfcA